MKKLNNEELCQRIFRGLKAMNDGEAGKSEPAGFLASLMGSVVAIGVGLMVLGFICRESRQMENLTSLASKPKDL